MQPVVTANEHLELQRLLQIIQDTSRLPGERRIALAKYRQILKQAGQRTEAQKRMQYA